MRVFRERLSRTFRRGSHINKTDKNDAIQKLIEADLQSKIEEKRKWNRTEIFTFVLAVSGIVAIIFSYLGWENSIATFRIQQETQAYTYWQNFLSLTVAYPEMANGIDSIDGFSIISISRARKVSKDFYSDSMDSLKIHDSTYNKYLKYAWFVTNLLNAAEIIYTLQQGDKEWEKALKSMLKYHSAYYRTKRFDFGEYEDNFRNLIREAMKEQVHRQ